MTHVFSKLYSKELDYFILIFPQILIISVLYIDIYFYGIIPIYLFYSFPVPYYQLTIILSQYLSMVKLQYYPGIGAEQYGISYKT